MSELKPCPFCGGEAELWHNKTWDYVVRCTNKGCAARTRQYHENSNGAVDAWNTRTPEQAIAAAPGAGECENVSDEPQHFQCSECRSRGNIRKAFDNGTRFSFCPDCGAKVKAVNR